MAEPKGAPIDKFIKVARLLDGRTILTPETFGELIAMARRLDEIEKEFLPDDAKAADAVPF